MNTINTSNSQINISIPRKISVISLTNKYLDTKFDVVKAADNCRYADGNDTRLFILGPIALFSNYKLTTCRGKYLDVINCAHIVSLM